MCIIDQCDNVFIFVINLGAEEKTVRISAWNKCVVSSCIVLLCIFWLLCRRSASPRFTHQCWVFILPFRLDAVFPASEASWGPSCVVWEYIIIVKRNSKYVWFQGLLFKPFFLYVFGLSALSQAIYFRRNGRSGCSVFRVVYWTVCHPRRAARKSRSVVCKKAGP